MEQKMFDDIKRAVVHDNLLAYQDFNKRFYIHANASDYKLVAVISQGGKPTAFTAVNWQDRKCDTQ